MGAGRRTETYLGPRFPSAGSPASSSSPVQILNLPVCELASVIFGCTHATYDECVNQLIFGLPRHHYSYIKNIQPGMHLFLFNYSDRKLHGIFEADSRGDLDINPYAWTGGKAGKTQFSAQVRVRVSCLCSPLSEKVFKEAIAANYYKDPNHFYFELNRVQTDMLLSLFTRNTTFMSLQAGPLARTQGGWIKPKKTAKSVMDVWHNAEPFINALAQTSPSQSEGRADTLEHWHNGFDRVEDETTAGNGGPDPEDAVNRSLEPAAEKSSDWRSTVELSNGKPSELEEDRRKAERELEVFEKLREMKRKGQMQSNLEIRVEVPRVREESQDEVSGSSSVESTKVQDCAHVEWEQLAREWCLQEQTMLREERELLREKFQALDAPVGKAINKNLEICASVIAEGRADTPEHWDDGSDKVEGETTAGNGGPDSEDAVNRSLEPAAEKSVDWRATVKLSNGKPSEVEEDGRKAERELEVFEKLRQLKQKGKMQSNLELRADRMQSSLEIRADRMQSSLEIRADKMQEIRAEVPRVREESQEEASGSSSVESTKVQDSARVEWERLARERCLQEQTMLREERELLREKFQALDAPVAKAINKNLEICASAIAQMRQDQIKLRHLMDEALNQAELVRELDQLRKKNAILEDTQVQMASELEMLKSDVARLSKKL